MAVCRIHPAPPACTPDVIEGFRKLSTTLVSDSMDRTGGLAGIARIGAGTATDRMMVGQALTVRVTPGDNLALHKALDFLHPGLVVAVDAGGKCDRAITGELMVRYGTELGASGFVVDGAVRDSAELSESAIPVFAAGIIHVGPYKTNPGEIRGAISMGGTVVASGDILIGDADGVVAVPLGRAEEILAIAEGRAAEEARVLSGIERGTYDRPWLDEQIDIEWVGS